MAEGRGPTALVVGGTGPTGPHVVTGLLERGYTVSILHSGRHENELVPAEVEHVHTNAFDVQAVETELGGRGFDLVVSMYGRLRDLAPLFRGRCDRFVSVGGVPVYRGFAWPEINHPPGLAVPTREDAPRATPEDNPKTVKMVETEDVVFDCHPTATHLRYPRLYGPHQVQPKEWCVVRRLLDGRRRIIVPEGGLVLTVLSYTLNAAQTLLLTVDRPDVACGRSFNVTDERSITVGQWVTLLAEGLGIEVELVAMPWELATPSRTLGEGSAHHRVLSVEALRSELGYRDVLAVTEALPLTARWLAEHPLRRGSGTERGLQDPFDYEAEDRLIEAWGAAVDTVRPVAEAADPGWVDRYAHDNVQGSLGIEHG